jgi:hypothetical protein
MSTDDGRTPEFSRKIAKVESTMLGYEDHGILTAMLHVSYGGSGQGVGGYGLDGYDETLKRRVGVAFGMEWVARVIRACGVRSWEDVKGRTIHVLTDGDSFFAQVIGIENLPTEPGERFVFADLTSEFYPESKPVSA